MGGAYLVDTNCIIDLFRGRLEAPGTDFLNEVLNADTYHLSDVTKIELPGFNGREDEMRFVKLVVDRSKLLHLTDLVVNRTIELRKERKVKLPDAIIAATALVHDLTIISRNTKDFKNIGVEVINPHDK